MRNAIRMFAVAAAFLLAAPSFATQPPAGAQPSHTVVCEQAHPAAPGFYG